MGHKRKHGSSRLVRVGAVAASAATVVAGVKWLQSPSYEPAFVTVPTVATLAQSGPGPSQLHVAGHTWGPDPSAPDVATARSAPPASLAARALATFGLVAALGSANALRRRRRAGAYGCRSSSSSIRLSAAMPEKMEGEAVGCFPPRTTPLLDSLNDEGPEKLRNMSVDQLSQLADEVRWQVLDAVSVTGGHLGSALGVVELTVALHHVFDTPSDELVFDVAYQVYPHKVITGRRDRIYTLRQGGGLSGFAKRSESEYDAFGAGHSSTSISAALGFAVARDLQRKKGHSVAVIGDGAITGGMAWEAMNHAGGLKSKMIVILNDNGQVSLPTFYNGVEKPMGALAKTWGETAIDDKGLKMQGNIAKIETSRSFQNGRQLLRKVSKSVLPAQLSSAAAKLDEYARDFLKTCPFQGSGAGAKGELFEQLGFYYVGPIDGHDIGTMVEVLENLKGHQEEGLIDKPILLHIKTRKGKGYAPAESASDKLHAVRPKFNLEALPESANLPAKKSLPALTTVFGNALVKEGKRDEKVVAITAAMPGGTGVSIFEKAFGPSRTFDVGIAEQHAVTFAAALAAGGLKPFCCIYSTFMQRGYDQIVHDVALQNLPVRFVLDRAGLVGGDGPTHEGAFDLSYLACIPNMKICAPADEIELVHMTHTLSMIDDGPSAMRYPRGKAYGDEEMPAEPEYLEPGKGRIVREGKDGVVALLSVGSRLHECLEAAKRLESWGITATVADARWVKPLDEALVKQLATDNKVLITIEENAIGGFSSQVSHALQESGSFDGVDRKPLVFRSMVIPDRFIAADDDTQVQYDDAELNATHIMTKIFSALSAADVTVDAPTTEDASFMVEKTTAQESPR